VDIQRKLRIEFQEYHRFYRLTADCNMKEIAKEMKMPRLKLYRWMKGKAYLNEEQVAYLKKLLTNTALMLILITMIHTYLYDIFSTVGKGRLIGRFFKREFDFLLNSFFVLNNTIKNILQLKVNYQVGLFCF
jgi:hypothetical protein